MPSGYEKATMLDTNLLVYSILADHPASSTCQTFIEAGGEMIVSSITPVEMFFVLTKIYGIAPEIGLAKIDDLLLSPLSVINTDVSLISTALTLCSQYRIDTNDAIQVQMCLDLGIPALATDDRKLAKLCRDMEIEIKNPITPELRQTMHSWEKANLPPKGLPRILYQIYEWLKLRDRALGDEFRDATRNLTRLP